MATVSEITSKPPEGSTYWSTILYQAKPVAGLYEFIGARGNQGGEMALFYPPNGNNQYVSTDYKITHIDFAAWLNTVPIGTSIEIWGVRANA